MTLKQRLWHGCVHLMLAFDQLANTLIFFAHPGTSCDETLSARAWRQSREGRPKRWVLFRKAIDWLFTPQDWLVKRRGEWTGARHCERAFEKERARQYLPPEYRSQP